MGIRTTLFYEPLWITTADVLPFSSSVVSSIVVNDLCPTSLNKLMTLQLTHRQIDQSNKQLWRTIHRGGVFRVRKWTTRKHWRYAMPTQRTTLMSKLMHCMKLHTHRKHNTYLNILFTQPIPNNTNPVTTHAAVNKISSPNVGNNDGITTYPINGNDPKVAKEQNIANPSFAAAILWFSSGTCNANSSVIMTSTKNSLYLAMVSITFVASSRLIPRNSYISIISRISPSG